jgi:serine O-acetyltransferase
MDEVSRLIKADLYRHNGLTGVKGFLKGWLQPGFRYTYLLRKTAQYKKTSFRGVFYWLLKRRYTFKYGYQISSEAQIGEGFYLSDHFGPVIIGPIKIGKNCNINHSVTIGRAYKGGKIGRPTIDDNVWIGTGSVIVGGINIGKNVLIAPNSFVNFNVPDNSLVIGNPAKIIEKENPTRYYINNILNE